MMKVTRTSVVTFQVSTDDAHPLIAKGDEKRFSISLPDMPWSLWISVSDIDRMIDLLRAYKIEVS